MERNMKTLSEIITDKPMVYASTGQSVFEVVKLMADKNVGAVPVLDNNGGLLGIFSERDVLIRCIASKKDMEKITVD
jgi:CBS domain-containing protein